MQKLIGTGRVVSLNCCFLQNTTLKQINSFHFSLTSKQAIFGFPALYSLIGGQQVLSPYHAMGGNPVSMVDPLGLISSPGSNIPNYGIPNAGVAYIEGKRVVMGGGFLNLAARQLQANERFTDFLIEAAIRDALGHWKATGQLGVPGAGSVGGNEQSGSSGQSANNDSEGSNASTGHTTFEHVNGVATITFHKDNGLANSYFNGIKGGLKDIWESFTTIEGIKTLLVGSMIKGTDISAAIENIPNYTSNDYVYGAGVLTVKVFEGILLGKVSSKINLPKAKGGSGVLSAEDALRIKNAATRIGKPITVVGSRARGTAGAFSDWDYVIEGLNNKGWKQIKNSLPGSKSVLDNTPRNIDIFKTLDPTKPHITIYPQ